MKAKSNLAITITAVIIVIYFFIAFLIHMTLRRAHEVVELFSHKKAVEYK